MNAAKNIWASGVASFNGSGAYVRPLIVGRKSSVGQRVSKEQIELAVPFVQRYDLVQLST